MDRFEEQWQDAVAAVGRSLAERGVPASDATLLRDGLGRLGFPGRLALLAAREGRGPVGGDLVAAAAALAARQPPLAQHGVDATTAARFLRAILIDRRAPLDSLTDESLQTVAVEAAARVLAAHGVGVSPAEARTALRLLTTGEFFDDLAATTATIVRFVPTLPLAVGRDIPRMPLHLARLVVAVLTDAPDLGVAAARLLAGALLDGAPTTTPKVMVHTMRTLYEMASVRATADTLRTLTSRDDESFRLALILYARANGIPLDEQLLDELHDRVFATDDPDLGPLLVAAIRHYGDARGLSGVRQLLTALARRTPDDGVRALDGGTVVREPPTRFEGVVFRLKADEPDSPADVVARVLGAGWHCVPFSPSTPRDFEAVPDRALSTAHGWDATHRLGADAAVERAEPRFETHLADAVDPTGRTRDARSLLAPSTAPGATLDRKWSLRLVHALDAWALAPEPGGARFGEGVLVGHPDTGYTQHRELGDRIVAGWDFLDDDADPTDPLDGKTWLLQFPGHGTGTASVLASADEPDADQRVTGVAPGAHVMPLRVSESVIHLSMGNVTKAIYHAVDHGCHVVSMSLGGLGFEYLHDAVRYAVERGVIVVAAAGNYVGFVTYPAAYAEVLAIGGCTVTRAPWSGSSHGPEVAFTAPAEGVWKAEPKAGDPTPFTAVAQSDGTSFATATVAGVAALWLAYHGRDRLIARYGASRIATVFRTVVKSTCQPGVDWDPNEYGSGVVDAQAVLAAPLPAAPPVPRALAPSPTTAVLDEVARQFPDVPRDDVVDGVQALLQLPDAATLEFHLAGVGRELVMHLATDRELRAGFRDLVARRGARDLGPGPADVARARLTQIASPRLLRR